MEIIIDPVEDIVAEAEISIRDAYQRGYQDAQNLHNESQKDSKKMLASFVVHINKNYDLHYTDEPILGFTKDGVVYRIDSIVRDFLLSYDDERES
jgi:hypothetical protein